MEDVSRRLVVQELKKKGQSPTSSGAYLQFLKEVFHLEDEDDDKKEPLKSLKSEAVVVTSKLRSLLGKTRGEKRTSLQNVLKKVGSFSIFIILLLKKTIISVVL